MAVQLTPVFDSPPTPSAVKSSSQPASYMMQEYITSPLQPTERAGLGLSSKKTMHAQVKQTVGYLKDWDKTWEKACKGSKD